MRFREKRFPTLLSPWVCIEITQFASIFVRFGEEACLSRSLYPTICRNKLPPPSLERTKATWKARANWACFHMQALLVLVLACFPYAEMPGTKPNTGLGNKGQEAATHTNQTWNPTQTPPITTLHHQAPSISRLLLHLRGKRHTAGAVRRFGK